MTALGRFIVSQYTAAVLKGTFLFLKIRLNAPFSEKGTLAYVIIPIATQEPVRESVPPAAAGGIFQLGSL